MRFYVQSLLRLNWDMFCQIRGVLIYGIIFPIIIAIIVTYYYFTLLR